MKTKNIDWPILLLWAAFIPFLLYLSYIKFDEIVDRIQWTRHKVLVETVRVDANCGQSDGTTSCTSTTNLMVLHNNQIISFKKYNPLSKYENGELINIPKYVKGKEIEIFFNKNDPKNYGEDKNFSLDLFLTIILTFLYILLGLLFFKKQTKQSL